MSNIPPKSIIVEDGIFDEFSGAFTENFVAQTLATAQQPLYYWNSSGTAEIDFIAEHELEIYPIEVKARLSQKKKSLIVYMEKYKPKISFRFSLRNFRRDGNIFNLPLYLASRFNQFI